MIKVAAIIFIAFFQTSESNQEYFERFKQTINEAKICTVGKKLNRTITILFWNKLVDGMIDGLGFEPFQTCLHKRCISTRDKSFLNNSKHIIDAIVFYGGAKGSMQKQNILDLNEMKQFKESDDLIEQMNQGIKPKIILFMPESPLGVFGKDVLSDSIYQGIFDITMTYRHDSEVVLSYGNFINRKTEENIMPNSFIEYDESQIVNNLTIYGLTELENRSRDVAWVVSHCNTISKREDYVKEMEIYKVLKIDIFGRCGKRTSEIHGNRFDWMTAYQKLAPKYKFYLSFENSRCYEYITEKFFMSLKEGMIPVVLGGLSKRDYEKIAPQHSFIHVDDFVSPRHLMKRLYQISKDPVLYNSYFWWRRYYDIVVNMPYWPNKEWKFPACQLCQVLHSENTESNKYTNFTAFWNKCIQ